MAIGNLPGDVRWVSNGFGEAVDVDVVIAEAVHFGETHV
jgi:hypothetical protein